MDDPLAQPLPNLLGGSPAFLELMEQVSRLAPLDRPVLIVGERGTGKELVAARLQGLSARWERPLVKVASLEDAAAAKTLDAEILAGSNGLTLYVFGNEKAGQSRVVAVFDNLGKGASGAAVQNLNIMVGLPETTGL